MVTRLLLLGLSLLLAGCSPTDGCGRRISARHVVLISMDTARADHFGFLGSDRVATRRLDALASESIVFTDYMTVAPTTLPSHTSLFTGKYPHHHGTPRNGFTVHADNAMLPEILKEAGFRTVGFAGSFALDRRFGFAQGFDHYDEDFEAFIGPDGVDQDQRRAVSVTDAVIRYLEAAGVPERLFLFVHYFDPHWPYQAPEPFDTTYDPRGRKALLPLGQLPRVATPARRRWLARRHALQYASEISYMDHHIGRLLDDLEARGVLDDALVVVTSDHGETFWEHPEFFDHGHRVYQTTMRAVWMLRLPGGRRGGTRISSAAASIDVLPSLLRLLGLPIPKGVDGEPLDLDHPEAGPTARARFGQAAKPEKGEAEADPRWLNMRKARCVRVGQYKFVQTPYTGSEELYHLESDPNEEVNLLETPTPETERVAVRLRAQLDAWADSAAPLPSAFEAVQMDETIERLKNLGYLR